MFRAKIVSLSVTYSTLLTGHRHVSKCKFESRQRISVTSQANFSTVMTC